MISLSCQLTVHDAESAMLVTPLPPMPSACALVMEGTVKGEISHVKDASTLRAKASAELLAVHLAAQSTVNDAELAMLVTQLPHVSSACVLVTEGTAQGLWMHVKNASMPNERAAMSMLAVSPAAQSTVHDAESAISATSLPQLLTACASVTESTLQGAG